MRLLAKLVAFPLAVALCATAPRVAETSPSTCVSTRLATTDLPLVLVKVRVNGTGPYTFFVDTGATLTVVGAPLARALNLPVLDAPVRGIGAGGRFSARASFATVSLGDVRQDRVVVGIVDLSQIRRAVGPVEGVIGYNFLKPYRVVIDYPGRQLCLETP
ncbi:MAG: retroviral-like aspartic protease family protein [Candidatus Eremiobacteraeota bacterium]|nr:retroviral-like aspartic protease family protein [Candidatus Eremiobacteraeota bacterium]